MAVTTHDTNAVIHSSCNSQLVAAGERIGADFAGSMERHILDIGGKRVPAGK